MTSISIHGYKAPSIPELDDDTIYQLNYWAAKDIAKRSVIGPFVCILGMLVTTPLSTILMMPPGLLSRCYCCYFSADCLVSMF